MELTHENAKMTYDNWYDGAEHEMLWFWENFGTFYVVTRLGDTIEGARIFPVGDEYEISLDYREGH